MRAGRALSAWAGSLFERHLNRAKARGARQMRAVAQSLLALVLAQPAIARESGPPVAPAIPVQVGAPAAAALAFAVDASAPGPIMDVAFIGNASRLDTLLALRSAADLRSGGRVPGAAFFRARYPQFRQFRIGNTFFGYTCAGLDFDEMAERRPDGSIAYRFDQTLTMLQQLVDAGIKPHLALTGTPLALVPEGEAPIRHPVYGCVNAPRIDWSQAQPRDRVPEWWALQDAFLGALLARFGRAEVEQWTFATWTEPINPPRNMGHLVLPPDVVHAGRQHAAVAAIVAASIDVAMKHKLRIRVGNLAGRVETEYPALMREIGNFPRGKDYLAYIDGYAVSRYRSHPRQEIGRSIDAAFTLLRSPAMPDKPIYIDELGDLSGLDGAVPFEPASGLAGGIFLATVLERVYTRQDGTQRSPRGVAIWRSQIGPRARNNFVQPEAYLATPSHHVLEMFASLNGTARLAVQGPARLALAGAREGQVRVVLLPPVGAEARLASAEAVQSRTLAIGGLAAGAEYEVAISETDRVHGNPIAAFLEGAPGHAQDRKGRFVRVDGRWKLASARWEACFFEEDASCAWRGRARAIENPRVRVQRISTDVNGVLRLSMELDSSAIALVQARALD